MNTKKDQATPRPNVPCKEGRSHSIGIFSGTCSNCGHRFWKEDKKKAKDFGQLMSKVENEINTAEGR